MSQSITITLPNELKESLDDLSHKAGITTEELIGQAIKQHVFLQQFRSLQERMVAKAEQQGILTDQDVFDRVS